MLRCAAGAEPSSVTRLQVNRLAALATMAAPASLMAAAAGALAALARGSSSAAAWRSLASRAAASSPLDDVAYRMGTRDPKSRRGKVRRRRRSCRLLVARCSLSTLTPCAPPFRPRSPTDLQKVVWPGAELLLLRPAIAAAQAGTGLRRQCRVEAPPPRCRPSPTLSSAVAAAQGAQRQPLHAAAAAAQEHSVPSRLGGAGGGAARRRRGSRVVVTRGGSHALAPPSRSCPRLLPPCDTHAVSVSITAFLTRGRAGGWRRARGRRPASDC